MKYLLLVTILLSINSIYAQTDLCGTKMRRNPIKNVPARETESLTIYEVPVIFHVLYRTSSENVHDSLIWKALEILNNDFMGLNADLGSVPEEFQKDIGNPNIKFVRATVLPNGETTTGIIRKKTKRRRFNHRRRVAFKESKIIAPESYLNVYICNLNKPGSTPTGSALTNNNSSNGIRVHYDKIKKGTRTITHEVGHWLTLYHTFEGGCNDEDEVDDTPAQKKIFICPEVGTEHCGGPIMFSNFMGYSECRNFFTNDQVARMHTYIEKFKSFKKAL